MKKDTKFILFISILLIMLVTLSLGNIMMQSKKINRCNEKDYDAIPKSFCAQPAEGVWICNTLINRTR